LFSSRTAMNLGAKRMGDGIYELSLEHASKLNAFLQTKAFSSQTIINYDETRIVAQSNHKWGVKRLVSREKVKPQHRSPITKTHCATFLPFLSADGTLIACYFILSSQFDAKDLATSSIVLEQGKTRHLRGEIYYKALQ